MYKYAFFEYVGMVSQDILRVESLAAAVLYVYRQSTEWWCVLCKDLEHNARPILIWMGA